MTYRVRIIFEDGSSKFVNYSMSYDVAIKHALSLADQRPGYVRALPLMKAIQLLAGDRLEFDMKVVRADVQRPRLEAIPTSLAGDDILAGSFSPVRLEDEPDIAERRSGELVLMSAFTRPFSALDMLTRWEPSRPCEAGFHSGLENATRTVRVMGAGIWCEADAQLYFDQQYRIVDRARKRFGALKVFFDVRNWVVETPQSALQFQDMNKELYGPDDRLVAVVRSSTAKQHPRTALRGGNTEVFVSLNAAEQWLQSGSNFG